MCRGEPLLEEQPHGIALVAEGGLDTDKDVAELGAEHEQRAAVGLLLAGCRAPLGLDLGQVRLASDMIVDRDADMHVGVGAETSGVAVDDLLAQRVDILGHIDLVAFRVHRLEGVIERGEDGQIGGRAGVAGVRREVEQHDGDLALGALGPTQTHQTLNTRGQTLRALGVRLHVACAVARAAAAAPAVDHGASRTVKLRDGDHHGCLDREQTLARRLPLVHMLEFDRQGGQIGDVQLGQDRFGRLGVVVGRSADQREAGERDDRIDRRLAVLQEEPLDRRARIQTACKRRDDLQAACFERLDHTIVVGGVAGQHVGAHEQQTDATIGTAVDGR